MDAGKDLRVLRGFLSLLRNLFFSVILILWCVCIPLLLRARVAEVFAGSRGAVLLERVFFFTLFTPYSPSEHHSRLRPPPSRSKPDVRHLPSCEAEARERRDHNYAGASFTAKRIAAAVSKV